MYNNNNNAIEDRPARSLCPDTSTLMIAIAYFFCFIFIYLFLLHTFPLFALSKINKSHPSGNDEPKTWRVDSSTEFPNFLRPLSKKQMGQN
jgi:hypothetical protein